MGKKSKTGKSRKDKFYQLAKETGYRARSAFKLIQLNRKYEFLQKSRVVLDLCAAPGGWLQVVAENTPVSSLIVGVDLVPIRPVRNCKTLVEDITTDKCRQSLKKELQTWKADSVIHDGAGNVGKNWLHDAFQQAQLTLQALKLATEFLKKGGWFVTKVFRSKDYNSLLWVFQQLFQKVHATKPQASRNESAEIFVVCEKFLAPNRIDPKFLDAKFVFKDVDVEPKQMINLIHPEKKRRQRDGYAEGDYTLYHTLKVSEFIDSDNHLDLLAQSNAVVFDDDAVANLPETTKEIKECLADIKVLGKKDIRSLIKWRTQVRKTLGKDEETNDKKEKEGEAAEDSEDEEAQIEAQLAKAKEDERKVLKRKLKKVRREKARLRQKMDMKMIIPGDKHDFVDDVGLFNLDKMKSKAQLDEVEAGDTRFADEFAMDELLEDAASTLHQKRLTYDREAQDHLDKLYSSSEDEEKLEEPELEDFEDAENAEEEDMEFEDDEQLKRDANPLIVSLEKNSTQVERKLSSWFNKESFAGLEDDADEDAEIEKMMEDYQRRGGTITGKVQKSKEKKKSKKSKEKDESEEEDSGVDEKQDSGSEISNVDEKDDENGDDDDDDDDSDESDSESSDSDFDPSVMKKTEDKKYSTKSGFEEVPAGRLDPVGLAIGTAMVQSRKRKRDILDGGYHRYMFDDVNLPEWFVKDESKHCKREMPVTKGDVQEYMLKQRAIDARPIKKIAQAKARKKKKEMRRLDRARKKAELITDTTDITDRDRWQQIKQVYKKAGLLSAKKKEVTYVVAKKRTGKRVKRPAGVQGPFKVVDGRMKNDQKKQKQAAKLQMKKGRKSGKKKK